jgi:hypothetical protein
MSKKSNELPFRTTSLKSSSDYTIPIHYTARIITAGDIIWKVERTYVNHIIHVTHVRPFGLHAPEAMSTHARLAKTTLVYCVAHTWLVPTPYANLYMSSPWSSWPASYRRTFLVIAHVRENTIIWYWLGIILSYAIIMYLNIITNKMYIITSNENIVWYDMVLHRGAWSTASDLVWSPSFHRYDTTSMVPSSWSCS